jgi:acyl carrier protein
MNNIEIYKKSFVESLSVSEEIINDALEYNSIPEWDSIAHMGLISELEDQFKITLETDDIIDFSSFLKGKEILKKYKIEF